MPSHECRHHLLVWAGLLGFTGVLAGTFGAHGLKGWLGQDQLVSFEIGVRYHLVHAVAVLALSAIALNMPESRWIGRAGRLMALGVILFSGSLYAMAMTDLRWLGWITPFGGVAFMTGWFIVVIWAIASLRNQTP